MSAAAKAKASGGKRGGAKDPDEAPRSDKRRRDMADSDPELELDSDFKQIRTMLRHIKDKAHKDGQKKTEQAISISRIQWLRVPGVLNLLSALYPNLLHALNPNLLHALYPNLLYTLYPNLLYALYLNLMYALYLNLGFRSL